MSDLDEAKFSAAVRALQTELAGARQLEGLSPDEVAKRLGGFEEALASFRATVELDTERTALRTFIEAVGYSVMRAQETLDRSRAARSGPGGSEPAGSPQEGLPRTIYRIPEVTASVKFDVERTSSREVGIIFYKSTTKDVERHQQSLTCKIAAVPLPPQAPGAGTSPTEEAARLGPPALPERVLTPGRADDALPPSKQALTLPLGGTRGALFLQVSPKNVVTAYFIRDRERSEVRARPRGRNATTPEALGRLVRRLGIREAELGKVSDAARRRLVDLVLDDDVRMDLYDLVGAVAEPSTAALVRGKWPSVVVYRLGRGDHFLLLLALDPDLEPRLGMWFANFRETSLTAVRKMGPARSKETLDPVVDALWEVQLEQRPFVRPEHALG